MTDESSDSGDLRRSFLKRGALAAGALSLGLGGGTAAAQDGGTGTSTPSGGGTTTPSEGGTTPTGGSGEALMYSDEFRPGAQFRVVSPPIEQNPDVEGAFQGSGSMWAEHSTRMIEYLNTNEQVYFFPPYNSNLEQGRVYELQENFSPASNDTASEAIVSVRYHRVGDEDVLIPHDDNQLNPGEDFQVIGGGGKALVRPNNFFPGSLLQITSGVVDWSPREDVQGSGFFSSYNTRHAEYLNTGDEFTLYTAQSGEFQQGGVYLLSDEFDITDPEGNLLTVQLERVNEDDLPDGLFAACRPRCSQTGTPGTQ